VHCHGNLEKKSTGPPLAELHGGCLALRLAQCLRRIRWSGASRASRWTIHRSAASRASRWASHRSAASRASRRASHRSAASRASQRKLHCHGNHEKKSTGPIQLMPGCLGHMK